MAATISYVLSFIATILGLIEPFGKKMKFILTLSFIGNFLVATSYLLVDVTSGAAICFVACVQLLINYTFDAKKKKIPLWLILIYMAAFLSVNLYNFSAWYDILALIASMLFVLSVAQSNPKYYRILFISNSTVWIFYDFLAKAYGNLSTHIILFVATMISMLINDKKR